MWEIISAGRDIGVVFEGTLCHMFNPYADGNGSKNALIFNLYANRNDEIFEVRNGQSSKDICLC